jgi:hypothetical protein
MTNAKLLYMNKYSTLFKICFIISWLFTHFQAQAQTGLAAKINYLSPLMGVVSLHGEWGLTDHTSLNISPFVGFKNFEGNGVEGWGVQVSYRRYSQEGSVLQGGYFSPYLRYRDYLLWTYYTKKVNGVVVEEGRDAIPINNIDIGFLFGKQWMIGDHLLIDLFGGFGVKSPSFKSYPDVHDTGMGWFFNNTQRFPLTFRGGSTIGYRF